MLNYDIGIAIGIPIHEFDETVYGVDSEVFEFRPEKGTVNQSSSF